MDEDDGLNKILQRNHICASEDQSPPKTDDEASLASFDSSHTANDRGDGPIVADLMRLLDVGPLATPGDN